MHDRKNQIASELTPRIGRVATRALAAHGFTRYDQLTAVMPKHLLDIHGVGPKAIRILEEELTARGLAFEGTGRRPDTA
jgi:predicted flap endonuclease-1-like 5' DNA nuclease